MLESTTVFPILWIVKTSHVVYFFITSFPFCKYERSNSQIDTVKEKKCWNKKISLPNQKNEKKRKTRIEHVINYDGKIADHDIKYLRCVLVFFPSSIKPNLKISSLSSCSLWKVINLDDETLSSWCLIWNEINNEQTTT